MTSLKYLITALAVAAGVDAASCSTKGTMTLSTPAEVSALASCETFTGSIALAKNLGDMVALEGIKKITGDLTTSSNKMQSLSSSTLMSIGGTWTMESPSNLGSVTFPVLSAVKGIMFANWPPGLTQLSLDTGIQYIDTINIATTQLNTLAGINPKTAKTIEINSNSLLQNVTMQLQDVSDTLVITGNSGDLAGDFVTVSFPQLTKANNIQFTQVGDVDLPALSKMTQGLTVKDSYTKSLTIPSLEQSGGITVSSNPSLTTLMLPKLVNDTGSFTITKNNHLTGTLSFPKLVNIYGAPNITGTFSGISMPKLQLVKGVMTISSTKNIKNSVCKKFSALHPSVIKGEVHCKYGTPGSHGKPSQQHSGSPSDGGNDGTTGGGNDNGNAAGHYQASLGLVFGGVTAIVSFLL